MHLRLADGPVAGRVGREILDVFLQVAPCWVVNRFEVAIAASVGAGAVVVPDDLVRR